MRFFLALLALLSAGFARAQNYPSPIFKQPTFNLNPIFSACSGAIFGNGSSAATCYPNQSGYVPATGLGIAANSNFTPARVFNVRDYGTNIGAAGSSGDDAAFTAAETAACAYGATYGAPGTSMATVYAPEGFQYNLSSTHNLNCQNSYEIRGQINSSVSSGAAFVINSSLPTVGQNQLASFHLASCVQVNGNTATPTGINASGGMCVEVRNMQFWKSFHIDQLKQFTFAGVYFNSSNNVYSGQQIQQNQDIRIGLCGFNGLCFKALSYSGAAGAFNANTVYVADMVSNYKPFAIDDSTHIASSSNRFIMSLETYISGGQSPDNWSYWNTFEFIYMGQAMYLGAGATGNTITAQNSLVTGAGVTDASGNSTNIFIPAGTDGKNALAAAVAGNFAGGSISSAAIAFGAGSISSAAINFGVGSISSAAIAFGVGSISGQAIIPNSVATKTANYTATISDSSLIFNCTASCTLTLPAASANTGRVYYVRTIAAFTVVSSSANVIPLAGGSASTAILAATAGKWAMLQSDGSNWQIMGAN
jgi:hypothetical protein